MPINKRTKIDHMNKKCPISDNSTNVSMCTQKNYFGELNRLTSIQKNMNIGNVSDLLLILMDLCQDELNDLIIESIKDYKEKN